jgi:hypothetical protein
MADDYPRAIVPLSNEREMLYLDAATLGAPGAAYNGLAAHELQHLVHWAADPTEDSWVNEGLSQVAAEQAGAGSNWQDAFLRQPDTQLTFWPAIEDAGVHYAAAELFFSHPLTVAGAGAAKDCWQAGRQHRRCRGVPVGVRDDLPQRFRRLTAANWLNGEGPYAHSERGGEDPRARTSHRERDSQPSGSSGRIT